MKTCPACALMFPDESTFCFLSGHTLESTPDPLVGHTVDGRFLVEALLSETSWSKLYAVRYRLRNEPGCLKLFHHPFDESTRQRFEEAIKCARRYSHDNLSELSGGGVLEDGTGYLVHPRSDARPLSASLLHGSLAVPMALGICKQLLAGLGRVHDFGGTHGSLRPSNILMSSNGHVELVHTGLGRVLLRDVWEDNPQILGAQMYLAPELSSQQRQSIAADLYALGAVAVHMLSGQPIYQADNVGQLLGKLRGDIEHEWSGTLPIIPDPVTVWLQRMLSTAPQGRPATAHQAAAELQEACEEAGVTPQDDPGSNVNSEPAAADRVFARWTSFRGLFEKMVEIGFPKGPPPPTNDALRAIQGRVQSLTELSKKADYEHGNLSDVMTRARDGRERIAAQMAELNATAKQIRKDLQPLNRAAADPSDEGADFAADARELHRELVAWEGRSGFAEPYRELAAAYRKMADLVDAWFEVRSEQLQREQVVAETSEKLVEIDSQLDELRDALRIHESNLGAEVSACETALAELGHETNKLDSELIDLAGRFSAPLRAKPELGHCFRELEKSV